MEKAYVKQSGNLAGGDIAGGDINKKIYYGATKRSMMSALIEKYKEEVENNSELRSFIEELEHYFQEDKNVNIRGVEEKLSDAGRDYEIQEAISLKELFVKKVLKHQFSPAAQKIFVYVLAEINSIFKLKIMPLIKSGVNIYDINIKICDDLLSPVVDMLEENILEINKDDIRGMLYFLTGNCHINWT